MNGLPCVTIEGLNKNQPCHNHSFFLQFTIAHLQQSGNRKKAAP